ncbi:MAG: glycerophosphodiester phosphodiesterase family protein [Bacilli bacterium]|jgi:glycerophosphoryl diester phosphodiesterase|nr:glycerophosphodiester phosphodiesterase family protein [Bacilli bacterium]MDD2681512.1 glycerophosphodiester phosphodiesterase family protein [Bacilli bacterium]MDD3121045.1 glycerophosphodiester phosphodiesterase family protein [Bacilli bacterium]MDD4063219.1 glycerophosphodiester phosphodiesterase family protein [Bacilli bacterium]MDD4481859.1 glycerophosphodiester phosphodiesterase family protein [Bacilli bacterium]
METLKLEDNNTKMIAHRGLSGLEKENTAVAFIAAGNRSYYGIETDIRLTKDGEFVISHDDNLKRVAGIDMNISNSTYDELSSICLFDLETGIPKNYLKIPTLIEYLEICKKYDKKAIIEIKELFLEKDIIRLIELVKKYNYIKNTIFISFYLKNLQLVRKQDSDVSLQFLTTDLNNNIINEIRKINAGIDIEYHILSKEQVELCHHHNIAVNVWTVNNPIVALMLITWNVDFITTNILE